MSEILQALVSLLQGIIVWVLAIGIFLSYYSKAERIEREAIENGLAYYDPKTRKFTWHSFPDEAINLGASE